MDLVTVYCSAIYCRFKENDDYYGECNNPQVKSGYRLLGNGHVTLSGCHCSDCEGKDCLYSKNMVSPVKHKEKE